MGTALIYIGCLFPEFENSEEYLNLGKKIIEIQLNGAIDSDGGSNETCISYSHFIARYYVECLLLLEKNGKETISGLKESINKQYEWMNQMSTPKGNTLLFNDSYSLSATEDIKIVKQLVPLTLSEKKSTVFEKSKCGVLRNSNFDLYFDSMDLTQVHQHAGRPNFVLYCKGEPLIVDSGCCCYDNHGIYKYFLTEWAHNTVLVYKNSDFDKAKKYADKTEILNYSENSVEFLIEGERQGVKFVRNRKIELNCNSAIITDTVELSEEAFIKSLIHLSAFDLTKKQNTVYIHLNGLEKDIKIISNKNSFIDYKPVVNERGEFTYSPVFSAKVKAQKATVKFEIVI